MGRAGEYTIADSCQKRRDERLEELRSRMGAGGMRQAGDGGSAAAAFTELGVAVHEPESAGLAQTCVSGERGCS